MEKCLACREPTDDRLLSTINERLGINGPPVCKECYSSGRVTQREDGSLVVILKVNPVAGETEITEIEDATKPSFETTTAPLANDEIEVRMKETPIGESVLKNVRLEASLGRTINMGNHEFLKPTAGIGGDVGDKDRAAGWRECWQEVEYQLGEEMNKMLTILRIAR